MSKTNLSVILFLLLLSACGGGFLSLNSVKKYQDLSASEFIEKRFCSDSFENVTKKITAGITKVSNLTATKEVREYRKREDERFAARNHSTKSEDGCSKVFYTTQSNPYQLNMAYNDVELFCHIKGGRMILIENGDIKFMQNYLLNPYVMSQQSYRNSRNIKFTTEILPGMSMNHEITKQDQAIGTYYRTLEYNNNIRKGRQPLETTNKYGYFGKYICQNRADSSEIFKIIINPISWHQEINRNLNNTKFGKTRILISVNEKYF